MVESSFGLQLLSPEQVNTIYEAALSVLERTGVRFGDQEILDLFAATGAKVDLERSRVHVPPSLVAATLTKVSSTFTLHSRDSKRCLPIGKPEVRFSNSTYDMWVLDYETGQRHKSTLEHVEKFVRLNDALDDIDIVGAQVVAQDVPLAMQQIKAAEMLLKNTTKPFVMNLLNAEEGRTVMEMVAAVAGSQSDLRERPFVVVLMCPDSPLKYETPVTEVLRLAIEHGLPVGVGPCPILGASSPITLAGTLTQTLAEALAGVALAKLLSEETPVYVGTTPFMMAPQGNLVMAAPECYLISLGYAQVCQHLGIPNSFSCTHTDSKTPTMQTGYEKAVGLTVAVLSGSPVIQVPAILDDGATTSFEQLVIEAEMAGAAKRLLKGLSVSEETLAVEVIHECAMSGSFLAHDHTVAHLRSELWSPAVLFRGVWEQLQTERRTLVDNAIGRVTDLLASHCPTPLPPDVEREVEKIVARASEKARR